MCSPTATAPFYDLRLSSVTGNAQLTTHDPDLATEWIAMTLARMHCGDTLDVLINGQNRGARLAARLMSHTLPSIHTALMAETQIVRHAA